MLRTLGKELWNLPGARTVCLSHLLGIVCCLLKLDDDQSYERAQMSGGRSDHCPFKLSFNQRLWFLMRDLFAAESCALCRFLFFLQMRKTLNTSSQVTHILKWNTHQSYKPAVYLWVCIQEKWKFHVWIIVHNCNHLIMYTCSRIPSDGGVVQWSAIQQWKCSDRQCVKQADVTQRSTAEWKASDKDRHCPFPCLWIAQSANMI